MSSGHLLEPYIPGKSLAHRADPRLKLLAMLGYIAVATALPARAWVGFASLLLMVLVAVASSGLPVGRVLKRAAPAIVFSGIVALGALFQAGEHNLLSWRFLWLTLAISLESLRQFVYILVRAWLSALVVGLYIAVTGFPDTVAALRGLGVPPVLTSTLALVYRYLFVLVDEALRLERARAARTFRPVSLRYIGSEARVFGAMLGSLFLRAYNRSERVYQAMLARGFDGNFRGLQQLGWCRSDTLLAVVWSSGLLFSASSVLLRWPH
ncbi:MAG: cobalt ECF transporter T component CbiQ [Anaerolineae bacterium]